MNNNYYQKYLKYKANYLKLKSLNKQSGGHLQRGGNWENKFTQAKELDTTLIRLDGENITDRDIRKIRLELEKNPRLTQLNLSNNQVTDEGISQLASIQTLQTLNLGQNHITAKGVSWLALNETFQTLYLHSMALGDEAARALAGNTTLHTLHLGQNRIGDEGAQALAGNNTLQTLYLGQNNIGDKGAQALAGNNTLQTLNLASNQIGNEGGRALADNTTMTDINLDNNQISDQLILLHVRKACTSHTDCKGWGPGPTDMACCKNKCERKQKDWAGVGYCPHECVGRFGGKHGTC